MGEAIRMVSPGEHAWVKGGLLFTRAALAEVDEDALRSYARDEEACGYVRGPARDPLRCDEAVALENLANKLHKRDPARYFRTGRAYFEFNTFKFEKAVDAALHEGRPVKVLYHSHLDAGAYFSPTDRAAMSMGIVPEVEGGPITMGPGPAYPLAFLVVSVSNGAVKERGLFVWDEDARDFVPSSFTAID
jgi:[CysO sulfur-carrier protein]-S-L-cysteine hydrolase